MLGKLANLDKRWIFLMMFIVVSIPIFIIGKTGKTFPEVPSKLAEDTYNAIEQLHEGDPVLLSFDFDPASEGELGPMATAFTKHVCEKKLKNRKIGVFRIFFFRKVNLNYFPVVFFC